MKNNTALCTRLQANMAFYAIIFLLTFIFYTAFGKVWSKRFFVYFEAGLLPCSEWAMFIMISSILEVQL